MIRISYSDGEHEWAVEVDRSWTDNYVQQLVTRLTTAISYDERWNTQAVGEDNDDGSL